MTQPHFQFTIGRLMLATFWIALSVAAWMGIVRGDGNNLATFFIGYAALVSPFLAIGTLREPRYAVIVALCGTAALTLIIGLAVVIPWCITWLFT